MGRKPRTKCRELLHCQGVHPGRRCIELNLMAAHGCEMELVPRDQLDRRPPCEDTETKTTQQRRRTDVDPHHSKLAIPPHKLDVRDPRQPPSGKVEDLGVQDVARKQKFVAGKPILDRILRYHDVFRERSDRGPRDPAVATPDAHA